MTGSTVIDQNAHLATITLSVGDQIMTVITATTTAFKERSEFNFLRKKYGKFLMTGRTTKIVIFHNIIFLFNSFFNILINT